MFRKAFTLIELLVIVAIMGTMVSVCVVSIRAGQGAARIKGATRDIMASIRHARSMALVMMQPTVMTYSTVRVDDEVCAQIAVEGAKLTSPLKPTDVVETLSGEPVHRDGSKIERRRGGEDEESEPVLGDDDGQTIEDVLLAPIATDVVRGVRIKVTMGDELLAEEEQQQGKANRISVFSNVDYLLGRYKEKKAEEKKDEQSATDASVPPSKDEDQEPVNVVWEANGRCDPHRVWVYLDGAAPESGLCIKIDRFGAAKVLSSDEE